MRTELHEYRWRPWFAWRTVACNTDGLRPNRIMVWWEWVYRATRWGLDGDGIMSTYTYLTPEKYESGKWDHAVYTEATEKVP